MDTGTHLLIGLGLAGLAHVDPVIAADPTAASAVLVGTVLGQQAPDFDSLLRLKGTSVYIRNHRGASHAFPTWFVWAGLITMVLSLGFGTLPVFHIAGWVLLAVAAHVLGDMFNAYGTQVLRPITDKWISLNVIHIFDPFLFVSHLVAIFMWSAGLERPEVIFPVLYLLIACYYVWRIAHHYLKERSLPDQDPEYQIGDKYTLLATISPFSWNIVKQRVDGSFSLGEWKNEGVRWVDRVSCHRHEAVEASKEHPDIASFLYFSSYACAELKEHAWGYEVRWADVRYRHRKQYPFVAVLLLDRDMAPIDSYVGWLSEERLAKKLQVNTILTK